MKEFSVRSILNEWQERLRRIIERIYRNEIEGDIQPICLVKPSSDRKFGEFTTDVAFKLPKYFPNPDSKETKKKIGEMAPSILAPIIVEDIRQNIRDFPYIDEARNMGGGFINFFTSRDFYKNLLKEIHREKENFGRQDLGKGKKVLLEFVSANPTGPLTVAHGRQAAIGDILARILSFCGYAVKKEYYNNDTGNQINLLGKSIYARYAELHGREYPLPEGGYQGEYIKDIAKALKEKLGDAVIEMEETQAIEIAKRFGAETIMNGIKKDLAGFGVEFDEYYSQEKLEKSGKVEELLEYLKSKELAYEKDSALWIKTTDFGDSQDRVLIKSDGSYTYRTPDIAYHKEKFERGFDILIDLWGPDHHAHVSCMKSAIKALGYKEDAVNLIIVQFCTLYRGKEKLKMSTRAGEFITLREVIDEVGVDATRFFFASRKSDSHLDFDLEIAKKKSLENPVYYIQYAHARICSIMRKACDKHMLVDDEMIGDLCQRVESEDLLEMVGEEEKTLASKMLRFIFAIESSAKNLDTQSLTNYAYELANEFQVYYQKGDKDHEFRVLSDNARLRDMRLYVVSAVRIVLRNCLQLLGITAPETM